MYLRGVFVIDRRNLFERFELNVRERERERERDAFNRNTCIRDFLKFCFDL